MCGNTPLKLDHEGKRWQQNISRFNHILMIITAEYLIDWHHTQWQSIELLWKWFWSCWSEWQFCHDFSGARLYVVRMFGIVFTPLDTAENFQKSNLSHSGVCCPSFLTVLLTFSITLHSLLVFILFCNSRQTPSVLSCSHADKRLLSSWIHYKYVALFVVGHRVWSRSEVSKDPWRNRSSALPWLATECWSASPSGRASAPLVQKSVGWGTANDTSSLSKKCARRELILLKFYFHKWKFLCLRSVIFHVSFNHDHERWLTSEAHRNVCLVTYIILCKMLRDVTYKNSQKKVSEYFPVALTSLIQWSIKSTIKMKIFHP